MGKIVQTAGRNTLGEFAPEFAHFNDDVLFGENWNNQDIDVKTRSIITVVALMASGITDSSLRYHLQNAKNHGVTQKEIAAVITHAAFYAGWPKAWAVFNLAKEVWETGEGDLPYEEEAMRAHAKEMVFPIGAPNDGFAQYFSGRSFLAPISTSQVGIFNVTFEPGCRNNWHIHHAKSGGGQILVCVAGRGYYQVEGKEAVEMKPGDCINIPAEVKHWHGAAPNEWFSHLSMKPYITELMEAAHEKGTPVMRPLFYDFPKDSKCWEIEDQYMFGPDVLVAPVTYADMRKRTIYLPEGSQWTNFDTEEIYEGGQVIEVDAPLSQIPVFTRNGRKLK